MHACVSCIDDFIGMAKVSLSLLLLPIKVHPRMLSSSLALFLHHHHMHVIYRTIFEYRPTLVAMKRSRSLVLLSFTLIFIMSHMSYVVCLLSGVCYQCINCIAYNGKVSIINPIAGTDMGTLDILLAVGSHTQVGTPYINCPHTPIQRHLCIYTYTMLVSYHMISYPMGGAGMMVPMYTCV